MISRKTIKIKLKEQSDIIIKIAYAIILPILTFITLDLFDYVNNMFIFVFFSSALCYTIPFWVNAFSIKKNGVEKIAPIIITDFICLYVVALFTSLIFDFVNAFRYVLSEFTGVTTMILSLIYLLIFLFSIPLYIYMNRCNKKSIK